MLERWGDSGPNLLCVHGMTSSRRDWVRLATRLAGGFRVYGYDQRGHGDAAGVRGPMTLERSVRDLQEVAAAVGGPIDAIVGHSWGGAVAILAGLRVPARAVIAIDPLIHTTGNWDRDYVDDMQPVFERSGADRERIVREGFAGLNPLDVDGKVHALNAMSIETLRRIGSENEADSGGIDLRDRMVDYPLPLYLALADPAESIVAADDIDFIRRRGGSNVTIRVFAGEDHCLHRSAFEEFARSVEAALG